MKTLFVSLLVGLVSSVSFANVDSSKTKITCSPANSVELEVIYILLDRAALPHVTAKFVQYTDVYSREFQNPIVASGDLVGSEFFDVVTLQGTVTNASQVKEKVKLKIRNDTLHFMDPANGMGPQGGLDTREWICQ